MMKNKLNAISFEHAKAHGLFENNEVSYEVFNGHHEQVGIITFPFLKTIEETLAKRNCYFGEEPFLNHDGIKITMTNPKNNHVAKLIVPKNKQIVFSAFDGRPCLEDTDTPFFSSVASETFWCS